MVISSLDGQDELRPGVRLGHVHAFIHLALLVDHLQLLLPIQPTLQSLATRQAMSSSLLASLVTNQRPPKPVEQYRLPTTQVPLAARTHPCNPEQPHVPLAVALCPSLAVSVSPDPHIRSNRTRGVDPVQSDLSAFFRVEHLAYRTSSPSCFRLYLDTLRLEGGAL
jgi:hypothetical protein